MDLFKVPAGESDETLYNEAEDKDEKKEQQKDIYEEYINKLEDYEKLFDFEAENVGKGYYRPPWNADIRHKELNPFFALSKIREYRREAIENTEKKNRKGKSELPFTCGMYSGYYINSFQFQSDG